MSLLPTLNLTFEMTDVLVTLERNGLRINRRTLQEIKEEFEQEHHEIEQRLEEIIREVMGDTPIKLSSPDDRSKLVYSREVLNKNQWKTTFNIGSEWKGATKRKKRHTEMTQKQFRATVSRMTRVLHRTEATRCQACDGVGKVRHIKKDGTPYKGLSKCYKCDSTGLIYKNHKKIAGLKLIPPSAPTASANGFSTSSETLLPILSTLEGISREFITKLLRFNSITTYLSNYVAGIERGLDGDGIVHPSFNQGVTATGRLSSSKPNFHNMPRERTFPIRKCVVSRFPGGKILDGDFSQLEFRVAGFLAQDKVIYEDVYDGVDVHQVTADVMGVSRQDAKADTFKPLYGGTTGSEAQKRYYAEFKRKYFAVAQWHEELGEEVLATGKMVLPSGREYMYPGVKRMPWGTVSHATTIKNYPVQGFATADLVPCACVALHRMMKEKQVKSLFINTVHDNLVIDVHPDEVKELTEMLKCAMLSIADETKKRYGIEYDMPIGIEVKLGDNWMEMETIYE